MVNATLKPKIPTETQRAVLDALKGGKSIRIERANGNKTLTVLGAIGTASKTQPELSVVAVDECRKNGWLDSSGKITASGIQARRPKAATV